MQAPASVDAVAAALDARDYLAGRALATTVFLALRMGRPLFLEGEAGVGKTELAKALAALAGGELLRLQCYEGVDSAQALYDWNYARQLLEIRLAESRGSAAVDALAGELYGERFLMRRPLLEALTPDAHGPRVLLIDELDRADEPFDAFLLEVLADFQVSIPEYGVIRAATPPIVVITSNRTREIHDAIRRRCLYHWVDFPSAERELAIVRRRLPRVHADLSKQVVDFVQKVRTLDLYKSPGIAETVDWAEALTQLDAVALDTGNVLDTLGVLLKYQDDLHAMTPQRVAELLQS